MYKRSISIFMSLVLLTLPTMAIAQEAEEGKLTTINMGEPAPYSGILLDSIAAAKINVDKKYSLLKYDLQLEMELAKIKAQHDLVLGMLQAEHSSLKERNNSLLEIKNVEIGRLRDLLKDNPNDYNHWWLASGAVVGIVTSIAIFYAATEVKE